MNSTSYKMLVGILQNFNVKTFLHSNVCKPRVYYCVCQEQAKHGTTQSAVEQVWLRF